MIRDLLICPRDPMMFRDGKPFDAGLGARSIGWPMPSTVAGHIRTRLWGERKFPGNEDKLRAIAQIGPFFASQDEKYQWDLSFPAPADAAIYGGTAAFEIVPLRPARTAFDGAASDLPNGLSPLAGARPEKEIDSSPTFWTRERTLAWLKKTDALSWVRAAESLGYAGPREQARLHVEIGRGSRNAAEGMLFRTVSREFDFDTQFRRKKSEGQRPSRACAIFSRVVAEDGDWSETDGAGPMGGEQRLAEWKTAAKNLLPPTPETLATAKNIRLQLVTPGAFSHGWKPAWVDTGEPPDCPGLKLRLISAAVKRPVAVSGFDMTKAGKDRFRPTRLLAPAGTVYFFEVETGDPRSLWLQSICDDPQGRRDGFGLALVGEWAWQ